MLSRFDKYEPRYYEDVGIGDTIPPSVRGPYQVMNSAKFEAWTGDFYPAHYDHRWATEKDRVRGVVIPGLHVATHLSQLVTDWMGPNAIFRKYFNRLLAPTFVGDIITMTGYVAAKNVVNSENQVECKLEGVNQDGTRVIVGAVTVSLESR